MWTALENVFRDIEAETGIVFSRQGSYEIDEKLPNDFYTFWNTASDYDEFYNNKPSRCVWEWNIFYYTNNPENIYSGLEIFIEKAREKGFLFESIGRDIMCDEPNYVGRTLKTTYVENLTN